jgi:predicted metal-dependent hydrolase
MQDYRRLVRFLKRQFPCGFKVTVIRTNVPKDRFGDCIWQPKHRRFRIRIHKDLPEDVAIYMLVHEWAHLLTWDAPGDDHGPHWSKAYGVIYRTFVADFLENKRK